MAPLKKFIWDFLSISISAELNLPLKSHVRVTTNNYSDIFVVELESFSNDV